MIDTQLYKITLNQDTQVNSIILHAGDMLYIPVETNCMFYEKEDIETLSHILTHRGVSVYDENNAKKSFQKLSDINWDEILNMLSKGIDKIINDYSKKSDLYMISSKSLGISIPADIRPVKQEPIRIIGTIPIILKNSERAFYSKYDFADVVENSRYDFIEIYDYVGKDCMSFIHQFECCKYESTFVEINLD